jgi:exonuclease VII large subunit
VVADADGHVLSSIASLAPGDLMQVRVADGRITTRVTKTVLDPISAEQETP